MTAPTGFSIGELDAHVDGCIEGENKDTPVVIRMWRDDHTEYAEVKPYSVGVEKNPDGTYQLVLDVEAI